MPAQRPKRPRGRRILVPRTPRDPAPVRVQLNTRKQHLAAIAQRVQAVEEGIQGLTQPQENTAKALIRVEIDLACVRISIN
jgi:ribosomal protein L44E